MPVPVLRLDIQSDGLHRYGLLCSRELCQGSLGQLFLADLLAHVLKNHVFRGLSVVFALGSSLSSFLYRLLCPGSSLLCRSFRLLSHILRLLYNLFCCIFCNCCSCLCAFLCSLFICCLRPGVCLFRCRYLFFCRNSLFADNRRINSSAGRFLCCHDKFLLFQSKYLS